MLVLYYFLNLRVFHKASNARLDTGDRQENIEFGVDADHSGGQYMNLGSVDLDPARWDGSQGQTYRYYLNREDPLWHWGSATWADKPPYTDIGWSFDGTVGGEGNQTVELAVTPFDDLNSDGIDVSVVHTLVEGEIVGIGFAVKDSDDPNDRGYDGGWWTNSHAAEIYFNADAFTDYILMPFEPEIWVSTAISPSMDTISVSLPDTFIFIGQTRSVPITIEEDVTGRGIISAQMNISYDSNVIAAIDLISQGTLSQGWSIEDTVTTGIGTSIDTVKVAMAAPGPDTLSGSGDLVLINFAVSDSAAIGDFTSVLFEKFFFNERDPVATTRNGSVQILERLFGDVSGSREVTAFDAALLLKSTVGLFAISDTVTADVSGDGTISAFDASFILRFVVGIITQFPAQTGGISKVVLAERNISIGDVEDLSDGRFAVPILIDEMDGILSGQLELSFDSTKLKPLDVTTSDLTSDYLFAHNAQDGRIRLSFAGAESVNGSGRIAEIIFEPIGLEIEAISEIDLISAQLNEGLFGVIISPPGGISDVPASYALHQNFPNPFNPETVIYYDLAIRSYVSISVFNQMGQKVATLLDKEMYAGSYFAVWNGEDDNGESLASGVYLYRMETEGFVQTRKLVLMR